MYVMTSSDVQFGVELRMPKKRQRQQAAQLELFF
jgi:hypothetical protein